MESNALSSEDDTIDSGLGNHSAAAAQTVLTTKEFATLSNGLLNKKRKENASHKQTATSSQEDSSASESANEDSYFRKFMLKEEITPDGGVPVSILFKGVSMQFLSL